MRKAIQVALIAALVLVGLAAFAQPTQININGSPGSVTATSNGTGNSVDLMFTAMGGTANSASWQLNYVVQSMGTFAISGNANPITATKNLSGSWDIDMHGQTLAFTFVGNDGNSVAGDIILTSASDGTNSPITFNGVMKITASSGSALFTSLWPANHLISLDFVFGNQGFPWMSDIAGMEKGATRTYIGISSGEVHPVPEPTTLALLGSGLVAIGGMLRRYKK